MATHRQGKLITMDGMDEPEVVDLVAQDADGRIMLIMIENRPWGSDPHQSEQLKAKINTYAQFALDGELLDHYPDAANRPISIHLHCGTPPDAPTTAIVEHGAPRTI